MLSNQRGTALLLVIILFATLFALLGISLDRGLRLNERIYKRSFEETALHLAEAGVEHAIHQLVTASESFQGISNYALETGKFSTSVSSLSSPDMLEIISTGTATANRREGMVKKTLKV
ncbi:hypothetical protein GF339_11830, partial [candidate division KSB3 bacterium]|nr:hypothetical protein [candidate division KSB3 bacterium]MBD3325268.1 hypothetical protein [candidate division KSB3 bacterium]